MSGIGGKEVELASLRAEFLALMSQIADTPAESRANAERMEAIRERIIELSSDGSGRPMAEMKGPHSEGSLRDEIDSISGEIADIRVRIKEAEASSDFDSISKLAMQASALESRRKALAAELESMNDGGSE
jgi:chromosome segregation ATPase